ncbi:MAG: hypothetical protein QOG16_654 [Actinomycetota bacterium]|nr:hypothetical protein [Actinomycetota bacterium]
MRRLIAPICALVAVGLPIPGSQVARAAETGVIKGRVVNETTGQPQGDVQLALTSGTDDGDSAVVARTRTGPDGRYVFDDLSTGDDRFYALDAHFQDGYFAGQPITLPADTDKEPVVTSTLRVWNTTSEPGVIAISRDDMFVVTSEDGVGVIESVTIVNTGDKAYIGRGAEMVGDQASGASFAFALPSGSGGFGIIDSTIDVPEVIPVDQGVAATIAIPPGENRITFSYQVAGSGTSSDLSRTALYPTLEMSIYAAEPLEIRSNRLVEGKSVPIEGKTYRRWSADETVEAGDPLQALAVAGGSAPLWPLIAAGLAVVAVVGRVAIRATRNSDR